MASIDLGGTALVTNTPPVFDFSYVGTAAGTTTIQSYPAFLHLITVNQRGASGKIIVYDSVGTSGTVIGSLVLGSQTFSDPGAYLFDVRTKNGLTVENTANIGLTVSFGK